MGLFSKKYTPDEIMELINALPEDKRAEVKAKMDDLYKAEDEREIDRIEEDKTDSPETADEKAEEVKEESEEIGKDVDEIEEEGTEDIETEEKPETEVEEAPEVEETKAETDFDEKDNVAEMVKQLTDRLAGIEERLSALDELKAAMDDYVGKQKEAFGYRGTSTGEAKRYEDMSADELKAHILSH